MTKQIKLSYLEPFIDQTQKGTVHTIVSCAKDTEPTGYLLSVHVDDIPAVSKALHTAGLKVETFFITQRGLVEKPQFPKCSMHVDSGI